MKRKKKIEAIFVKPKAKNIKSSQVIGEENRYILWNIEIALLQQSRLTIG